MFIISFFGLFACLFGRFVFVWVLVFGFGFGF